MISFEKIESPDGKRRIWKIKSDQGREFHIIPRPKTKITKNFEVVTSTINKMSEILGQDFDNYLFDLLSNYNRCRTDEEKLEFMRDGSGRIMEYANAFVENNGVDYSALLIEDEGRKQFSNFPYDVAIKEIMKASAAHKIGSLLFNTSNGPSEDNFPQFLNLICLSYGGKSIQAQIMDMLAALDGACDKDMRARSVSTDSGRIMLILSAKVYEPTFDLIEAANVILRLLPILEHDRNPIPLFIGIIKNVRAEKYTDEKGILYVDEHSGGVVRIADSELLLTHRLGRLVPEIRNHLLDSIRRSPDHKSRTEAELAVNLAGERLKTIEYVSPFWRFLAVPILERTFGIKPTDTYEHQGGPALDQIDDDHLMRMDPLERTYRMRDTKAGKHQGSAARYQIDHDHLMRMDPEEAAILSFHVGQRLRPIFREEYANLFRLAFYFPIEKPQKSSEYRLKNVAQFIDTTAKLTNDDLMRRLFGSRVDFARFIEHFVGVMMNASLCGITTGLKARINVATLEEEAIEYFYRFLFTKDLDGKFGQLLDCIRKLDEVPAGKKESADGFTS